MKNGSTFTHQALQGICQNFPKNSEILGRTLDARELMLLREMEKKKIREEIITSGLLRRRELEAEVIREMMTEGEIDASGDGRGLLLKDSLVQLEVQGYGFGERQIGLSRQQQGENYEKVSVGDEAEGGGVLGGFPFQRLPEAVLANRIAIATEPITDVSKAKPLDSDVSGMKRKSEAPITELLDGTPTVDLSKKPRSEWSCSLCSVTATSEKGLNDHLKGKKHKTKEKALAVVPVTTKPVNKNADNSEALVEEAEYSNGVDSRVKLEVELKNTNDGADTSKNEIMAYSDDDFTFFCNTCKYGTNNEEEMTSHQMGKLHMTLWQASGGGVTTKKTMPDNMQYVCKTNCAAAEGKEGSKREENYQNADEADT